MSEPAIPTEMIVAATKAVQIIRVHTPEKNSQEIVQSALRAAGVPELLARIAELEAALRDRICEGCNALVANVGMLHLCGCEDQRNLCSACKAGCACAGGE